MSRNVLTPRRLYTKTGLGGQNQLPRRSPSRSKTKLGCFRNTPPGLTSNSTHSPRPNGHSQLTTSPYRLMWCSSAWGVKARGSSLVRDSCVPCQQSQKSIAAPRADLVWEGSRTQRCSMLLLCVYDSLHKFFRLRLRIVQLLLAFVLLCSSLSLLTAQLLPSVFTTSFVSSFMIVSGKPAFKPALTAGSAACSGDCPCGVVCSFRCSMPEVVDRRVIAMMFVTAVEVLPRPSSSIIPIEPVSCATRGAFPLMRPSRSGTRGACMSPWFDFSRSAKRLRLEKSAGRKSLLIVLLSPFCLQSCRKVWMRVSNCCCRRHAHHGRDHD